MHARVAALATALMFVAAGVAVVWGRRPAPDGWLFAATGVVAGAAPRVARPERNPPVNPVRQLDDRLLLAINSLARNTSWLHGPMLAYATFGAVLFGLLLLAGVLVARHDRARVLAGAGWACLAPLLALGFNQPLGHVFREARPYVTHPQILRLADVTTDFSFPSDHAVMGGAVAAGLFLVHHRLGLTATVAAVVMAFARVYIGAHYPWDVAGGLAFGALVTALGWWLLRRPLTGLAGWLRHARGVRQVFAASADHRDTVSARGGAATRP